MAILKDPPTITEVEYSDAEETLRVIRFAVFVDEQNVPPEVEMDERDPHCIHLLALIGEAPVATARVDIAHEGKVGRLAVLARHRRQGIGRALMLRCHEIAANHGLSDVWCNAQVVAVPFYESLGYAVESEVFDEAGIDHVRMRRRL